MDPLLRAAPLRFILTALLGAAAVLLLVCAIPDSGRDRFNALHAPAVVKLGWIYERLHDDPTPVDVAFIGTSRTVYGVDSAHIEDALHQAGRDLHVINLGVQHPGRNMHDLLARELLTTRKPKLLVLEVTEDEARDLHPAFAEIAPVRDVVTEPLIINISYFNDLSRLPRRQLRLTAAHLAPSLFGEAAAPDYRGPHWDDTYAESGTAAYPIHAPPRIHHPEPAELKRELSQANAADARKLGLPPSLSWLERRVSLLYVQDIMDLARAHDVPVALLYLHTWSMDQPPAHLEWFQSFGPVWQPPAVLNDPVLWTDINHFNHDGAQAFGDWVAGQIAADPRLKN